MIPGDWGDYGEMLQHGMTAHLHRREGMLSLERTGPYIPPITFPGLGDIILTANGLRLIGVSTYIFRNLLPHRFGFIDPIYYWSSTGPAIAPRAKITAPLPHGTDGTQQMN